MKGTILDLVGPSWPIWVQQWEAGSDGVSERHLRASKGTFSLMQKQTQHTDGSISNGPIEVLVASCDFTGPTHELVSDLVKYAVEVIQLIEVLTVGDSGEA